jgi:hypothetical protein
VFVGVNVCVGGIGVGGNGVNVEVADRNGVLVGEDVAIAATAVNVELTACCTKSFSFIAVAVKSGAGDVDSRMVGVTGACGVGVLSVIVGTSTAILIVTVDVINAAT